MWGWVKKAAKAVGHAVKGTISAAVQVVKGVVHRVTGIPEFVGTLFGYMPLKQIAIEPLILMKDDVPLAGIAEVQAVLDLAADTYREQMNVQVVSEEGPLILSSDVPAGNLSVTCYPPKVLATDFSSVGGWFRDHQAWKPSGTLFGYGQPVTVFIVEEVEGEDHGCSPGFLADYAVLDPGALIGSEATKLLLAHEVAHSCGLWHYGAGNLMKADGDGRTRHLSRLQKAIFRSSGHVTGATGTIE